MWPHRPLRADWSNWPNFTRRPRNALRASFTFETLGPLRSRRPHLALWTLRPYGAGNSSLTLRASRALFPFLAGKALNALRPGLSSFAFRALWPLFSLGALWPDGSGKPPLTLRASRALLSFLTRNALDSLIPSLALGTLRSDSASLSLRTGWPRQTLRACRPNWTGNATLTLRARNTLRTRRPNGALWTRRALRTNRAHSYIRGGNRGLSPSGSADAYLVRPGLNLWQGGGDCVLRRVNAG